MSVWFQSWKNVSYEYRKGCQLGFVNEIFDGNALVINYNKIETLINADTIQTIH